MHLERRAGPFSRREEHSPRLLRAPLQVLELLFQLRIKSLRDAALRRDDSHNTSLHFCLFQVQDPAARCRPLPRKRWRRRRSRWLRPRGAAACSDAALLASDSGRRLRDVKSGVSSPPPGPRLAVQQGADGWLFPVHGVLSRVQTSA